MKNKLSTTLRLSRRIAFLASLVGVLHVGAAPFVIAQRGQPANCMIVLPSAPSEAENYAAQELQNFTKRMTGVELPVASAPVDGKNAVILSKARKDLPRDAFHLAVKGNRLLVEAGSDSGVLYGVYELLERHGGCRWYSSWCEKVPSVETFSVPDALNDTQKPAFLMREPFWADMIRNPDFACRNRVNGGEWMSFKAKHGGTPYRYGGGLHSCHTFNLLCPPAKYFDQHPEYFSEVNGKRLKDRTQLCLTNPDVLRIVTSNVLARIRKDPGAAFYGISQNDWYNFCTCPKCKEIDDREESLTVSALKALFFGRRRSTSRNCGTSSRWRCSTSPVILQSRATIPPRRAMCWACRTRRYAKTSARS